MISQSVPIWIEQQRSVHARSRALVTSETQRRAENYLVIRPAKNSEQIAIETLVRSERMNPTGLFWQNFLVAVDGHGLAGVVQMRNHKDGSRELGSLVVRQDARGHGIAACLIDSLLGGATDPIHMITNEVFGNHYRRWGFAQIAPGTAPRCIRLNHRIGRLASIITILKGLPRRRLVILERPASADQIGIVPLDPAC